jgi:ribosomal protein S18 acetylase RimI-like enzyme
VAEAEMRGAGLRTMILSTTNDNLPALYFYQRRGFVIEQVLTGVALDHHQASGEPETGFGGIAVRDEIRLSKQL